MIDWINSLFATTVGGGVYLTIGAIGAVLLIISLFLDGIFDFFDFGDGPLSLTTIAAFATLFGFTAYGLVGFGMSVPVSGMLGGLAGLFGGVIAWLLARFMRNSESNTATETSQLAGLEAVVVLDIPGAGAGLGEISLTIHGERITLAAMAEQKITRGTKVLIKEAVSPTSVIVEKVLAEGTE